MLAPEIEVLQMGLKKRNTTFLENGSTNFDYVLVVYGDHLRKYKFIGSMFGKAAVHALGTPTRDVNFLENGLTYIDSVLIMYKGSGIKY
jgi:hypothetical protein